MSSVSIDVCFTKHDGSALLISIAHVVLYTFLFVVRRAFDFLSKKFYPPKNHPYICIDLTIPLHLYYFTSSCNRNITKRLCVTNTTFLMSFMFR